MTILYKDGLLPDKTQLLALYQDAGWTNYTKSEQAQEMLLQACQHSLCLLTAWSQDNQLLGLARVVGDGYSLIYLQDLLVLKSQQNQGIGSALLKQIQQKYSHVYQKVLITGQDPKILAFYQKNDWKIAADYGVTTFVS